MKISNNHKVGVGESVALLVAHLTNNRKVVGSMPANIVCISVDR